MAAADRHDGGPGSAAGAADRQANNGGVAVAGGANAPAPAAPSAGEEGAQLQMMHGHGQDREARAQPQAQPQAHAQQQEERQGGAAHAHAHAHAVQPSPSPSPQPSSGGAARPYPPNNVNHGGAGAGGGAYSYEYGEYGGEYGGEAYGGYQQGLPQNQPPPQHQPQIPTPPAVVSSTPFGYAAASTPPLYGYPSNHSPSLPSPVMHAQNTNPHSQQHQQLYHQHQHHHQHQHQHQQSPSFGGGEGGGNALGAAAGISLPPGWFAYTDQASGRTYYSHPDSGQVSWTVPPAPPPAPPPVQNHHAVQMQVPVPNQHSQNQYGQQRGQMHQVGPQYSGGGSVGGSGGATGARPGPSYPPNNRPPKRARPGAGSVSGPGPGPGSKPLSPRATAYGGGTYGHNPSNGHHGAGPPSQYSHGYAPQEASPAGALHHPVAMQTSPVMEGMASPPEQQVGYVVGGPHAGQGVGGPNFAFGNGGVAAAAEDTASVAGTVSSFASASPSASVAGGGMGGGAPGSEYIRRCQGCQQPKPQSAFTPSQWRKGRLLAKCVPCTEIDRRVAEAVSSARQCASCRQSKDRASFSTRQWTLRGGTGRCIACTEEDIARASREAVLNRGNRTLKCSECGQAKAEEEYTSTQWGRPASKRTCKICVDDRMKSKRKRVKNTDIVSDADGAVNSTDKDSKSNAGDGTEDNDKALDNRRLSGHESSSDDDDDEDDQPATKKTVNNPTIDGETEAQSSSKRRCPAVDEAELTLEKVRLEEEGEPSAEAPRSKNSSTSKGLSTKRGTSERQILRSSSSASSDALSNREGADEAVEDEVASSFNDSTVGAGKARSSSFSDPRSAKRGRRSVDPVDESLNLDKVKLSEPSAAKATSEGAKKKKRSTEDEAGGSKASSEEQSKKKRPANAEGRAVDPKNNKRPATIGADAKCDVGDTTLNKDHGVLVDTDPASKKKKCAAAPVKNDDDDDTSLDLGKVCLDDEKPPTTTGRGRGPDDEGGDAPSRKKKRKESHGGHNDEEEAYKEAISAADEKAEDDNIDGSSADQDSKAEEGDPKPEEETEAEAVGTPHEKNSLGQDKEDGSDVELGDSKKESKDEPKSEVGGNSNEDGEDEIYLESKAYRAAITSADEADDCEEQVDDESNVGSVGGKKMADSEEKQ